MNEEIIVVINPPSKKEVIASRSIRVMEIGKMKSKMRLGKNNGRWRGGTSVDYYRRKAGKKPGDKKIVHHLDKRGPKHYSAKSKTKLIPASKHNKLHNRRGVVKGKKR